MRQPHGGAISDTEQSSTISSGDDRSLCYLTESRPVAQAGLFGWIFRYVEMEGSGRRFSFGCLGKCRCPNDKDPTSVRRQAKCSLFPVSSYSFLEPW